MTKQCILRFATGGRCMDKQRCFCANDGGVVRIHAFAGYSLLLLLLNIIYNKYVVVVGAVDMWTSLLCTSYPVLLKTFAHRFPQVLSGMRKGRFFRYRQVIHAPIQFIRASASVRSNRITCGDGSVYTHGVFSVCEMGIKRGVNLGFSTGYAQRAVRAVMACRVA